MEKMPVIFVGHGDPMIALKINEMTETLKKSRKRYNRKAWRAKSNFMYFCSLVHKRYFYSKY